MLDCSPEAAFLHELAPGVLAWSLRLAVNTHQHGDHTYGNSVLPESTVLIAHEATREGLLVAFNGGPLRCAV